MTFKNEGAFNRWWTKQLRDCGAQVIVLAGGNQFQQAGLPDRLVIHKRFFGFIEGKFGDGQLSDLQRKTMREMLERGAPAYILRYDHEQVTIKDVNTNSLHLWDVNEVTGECMLMVLEKLEKVRRMSLLKPK